jgi:hypothetical protein
MELEKKATIADDIFFLVMDKLSRKEYEKFVIDNPDDDGTINTDLGSELYYDIESILDVYD